MRSICKMLLVPLAVLFTVGRFISVHAAEAPLPADAQQFYDRGLIAAEQEAWDLAISNFTQAQKSAERHPRILYYLGLAHARAGHEPAGAAWLQAYLAAAPSALNTDAVRKDITYLESVTDANIRKIYKAAVSAAIQVPSREIRMTRLYNLCVSQADAGLFNEFQKTRDELCKDYSPPGSCENIKGTFLWQNYIAYLAEGGEFQEAGQLAKSFPDNQLILAFVAEAIIIHGRVSLGDCKGARDALSLLEERNKWSRSFTRDRINAGQDTEYNIKLLTIFGQVMLRLAEIYAENGQPEDYRRLVTEADQLAAAYNLSPELRSDIAAAMKKDPAGMKICPDLDRMDPVEEWIKLARETSGDKTAVDLKGRLLETRKEASSDKLSYGLTKIGEDLAKLLKKIHALEKQCEFASSLKK